MFPASGGGLANGASTVAVLCNDDIVPGSNFKSSVSGVLPVGEYIIMISHWSTTSSPMTLQLFLSYTPDTAAPTNDDHTTPLIINTGVQTTQGKLQNIHHATDSASEQALNANCEIYNSVWYQFTAPETGFYRFSLVGSQSEISKNFLIEYTSIGIYDTTTTTLYECEAGYHFAAVTDEIYIPRGTTRLVRLGIPTNNNIMPGTIYKIRPILTNLVIQGTDPYLETGTGWITKNWDLGDNISGSMANMTATSVTKSIATHRANSSAISNGTRPMGESICMHPITKQAAQPPVCA